jgi:hypothetical protein
MSNQSPSQARGTAVASSLDSYDAPEAIQELNSIDLDGGKEQQLEHILCKVFLFYLKLAITDVLHRSGPTLL